MAACDRLRLLPVALRATVLVPAEFREVVNGADIIAYGRVSSTEARWSDDRKHVDTLVTSQAGTYLKGGPGETLVFAVPGGTIGRYLNVIVGAPRFNAGDEAVLLPQQHAGATLPSIFGLNQGVFRVAIDRSQPATHGDAAGDGPRRAGRRPSSGATRREGLCRSKRSARRFSRCSLRRDGPAMRRAPLESRAHSPSPCCRSSWRQPSSPRRRCSAI